MGLDNHWMYKTGNNERGMPTYVQAKDVTVPLDPKLGWRDCFRGKLYDHFTRTITGQTLYQEEISNKTLLEMATKLEECKPYLEKEYQNCCIMFRAYADAGCVLIGKW